MREHAVGAVAIAGAVVFADGVEFLLPGWDGVDVGALCSLSAAAMHVEFLAVQ